MKTYQFTVIIPDVDDENAESLYNRCPDSSLGSSNGIPYVAFDREANSLEAAIHSAIEDLRKVGIQPRRIEMEIPATVA